MRWVGHRAARVKAGSQRVISVRKAFPFLAQLSLSNEYQSRVSRQAVVFGRSVGDPSRLIGAGEG